MHSLYDSNGYIDMRKIIVLADDFPLSFIVGGRGTGKTYGALKTVVEDRIKFILMRRTQAQLDLVNKPDFCPFKAHNLADGWDISTGPLSKYNVGFYHSTTDENGKLHCIGEPLGYSIALSTVSNLRGFDASDVEILLYDEFIPERHDRPIKEEGKAFLNAYETINRNRELQGRKPLKAICMANANDLGNPIFMELGLIAQAEKMLRKHTEIWTDKKRGIALYILRDSPISMAKKDTVLYRASQGSNFADMAINNTFDDIQDMNIKTMPITEILPFVNVGEITVYKQKSGKGYYVSTHGSGSPERFTASEKDLLRFLRKYGYLWDAYMRNLILFENSTAEVLFNKYFS